MKFSLKTALLALLWLFSALSGVDSKAAGAAWLWFVVAGFSGLFVSQQPGSLFTSHSLTVKAAWAWLVLALLAIAWRAVGMVHWNDSWQERHAEIRMALTALAVWVWVRFAPESGDFSKRALDWASYGMAVACLSGLLEVLQLGRWGLTTHPVAWAGGMALMSLWLLHRAIWATPHLTQRWILGSGAFCGLLAVLASQSRGAFGVVVWWLLAGGWHVAQVWRSGNAHVGHRRRWLAAGGVALLVFAALSQTAVLERSAAALRQAVHEYQASSVHAAGANETSFGARIYLWQRSLQSIAQSPVWGYGQTGRIAMIKTWGQEANSAQVMSLGHVHNQYLNDAMDNGIWGLGGGLVYVLGLGGLGVWLLSRKNIFAGWTLFAIAFLHGTLSLSSVTFAHNYYGAVLAWVVGLTLLSSRE